MGYVIHRKAWVQVRRQTWFEILQDQKTNQLTAGEQPLGGESNMQNNIWY